MPLIVELRRPPGQWQRLGELREGDPDGSLSHNGPAGRQLYRFGCRGNHSILERSIIGADRKAGPARIIASLGFEEVARLTPRGGPFECWIKTDRMPEPHRIRFRHQPEE